MSSIINHSSQFEEQIRLQRVASQYTAETSAEELSRLYADSIRVLRNDETSVTVPVGRSYLLTLNGLEHSRDGQNYVPVPVVKGLRRLAAEFLSPSVLVKEKDNVLLQDNSVYKPKSFSFGFDECQVMIKPAENWTVADVKDVFNYLYDVGPAKRDGVYCIEREPERIVFTDDFLESLDLPKPYTSIYLVIRDVDGDIEVTAFNDKVAGYHPIDIDLDSLRKVLLAAIESTRSVSTRRAPAAVLVKRPSEISAAQLSDEPGLIDVVKCSKNLVDAISNVTLLKTNYEDSIILSQIGVLIKVLATHGFYRKANGISYLIEDNKTNDRVEVIFYANHALGKIQYAYATGTLVGNPVSEPIDVYNILLQLCFYFLNETVEND